MAKYHDIKDALAGQIHRGELLPGAQLMSVRDLMRDYGASYATVSKALAQLSSAGLIEQVWGKGVFVREARPQAATLVVTFDDVYQATHPFLTPILRGIGTAAVSQRWQVQICPFSMGGIFGGGPDSLLVQLMNEGRIGGVICCSAHSPEDVQRLGELGIATVSVNFRYPNQAAASVMPDVKSSVRQIVKYLKELRHRDVGLIVGPAKPRTNRVEGGGSLLYGLLREEMKKHGLRCRPDWVFRTDYRWESIADEVASVLGSESRPTAIVSSDDLLAMHAIERAESLGVRVPEDLSVISTGDILHSSRLTSIAIDLEEMGRVAFRQMRALAQGEPCEPVILPTHLRRRASSAPACPSEGTRVVTLPARRPAFGFR